MKNLRAIKILQNFDDELQTTLYDLSLGAALQSSMECAVTFPWNQ